MLHSPDVGLLEVLEVVAVVETARRAALRGGDHLASGHWSQTRHRHFAEKENIVYYFQFKCANAKRLGKRIYL